MQILTTIPSSNEVEIQFFSLSGKLLAQLVGKNLLTQPFDIPSNLPSGLYLIKLVTPTVILTERFIRE